MALTNHLVIFARVPRMGTGKRRLAADIGAVAALAFQRTTLAGTVRRLARTRRWKTWLALTPAANGTYGQEASVMRQPRGDLGTRMGAVAASLPPGPVIIVGSDIPAIRPRHIAEGFRLLGARDAVFGPASDGGYWLIGLRRRPRFICPFDGVRWSTPNALKDTLRNLPGHRIGQLDCLDDIDTGEDYRHHNKRKRKP